MSLIVTLVICIIFALLCAKPLHKLPWLFYLIALVIGIGGVYFTWFPNSNVVVRAIVYAIQKGHVAFSLFAIVMFIGVFAKDSWLRQRLGPVRGELSIMAAILIIAHFVPYARSYLQMGANLFSLRGSILLSFIMAVILLVLLVLLTITSIRVVKAHMQARPWKNIQRWAYVFFIAIFVHLSGFLLIPAIQGSTTAIVSIVVYYVIAIAYIIARLVRYNADKKATAKA
jgi:DMSO/TMAO reductase YedYZ heme-binding membrane subunit